MRFKGLGEMQPEERKRTTLDPNSRRLLRVNIVDVVEADRILTDLMGKDVEARFNFIRNAPLRRIWICRGHPVQLLQELPDPTARAGLYRITEAGHYRVQTAWPGLWAKDRLMRSQLSFWRKTAIFGGHFRCPQAGSIAKLRRTGAGF
jgi:hypothetical protein